MGLEDNGISGDSLCCVPAQPELFLLPLRLLSTQVTPQEGLHGAVPPRWLPLAGDTGRRRVCCWRFETKSVWGWSSSARLCRQGEAVTHWALASPWPGDPWGAGLGGDVSPLYIVCIYQ